MLGVSCLEDRVKKFINRIRKVNINTFGNYEKLDYRKIYKGRLEKAQKENEPLN